MKKRKVLFWVTFILGLIIIFTIKDLFNHNQINNVVALVLTIMIMVAGFIIFMKLEKKK